jgi:type IV pilus assembly protein PilW
MCNKRGITLLELLVALVISGIVIGGIYRLFIAQTRAYTVQDQVVEVQRNVRCVMEILLRDLRMAGFDDDNPGSTITIANPVVYPPSDNSITVSYEYYERSLSQYEKHTVTYNLNAPNLIRQLTVNDVAQPPETVLENVDSLNFAYGVDQNRDGIMDDQNGDSMIDSNDWLSAAGVGGRKIIAIRVALSARPNQTVEDVKKQVSPRTLISAITLRNLAVAK